MEIVLAVAIAVIGWIATHFLTIRAQKKAFINSVKNEARIQINRALREYKVWVDEVVFATIKMSSALDPSLTVPPATEADFASFRNYLTQCGSNLAELVEESDDDNLSWNLLMEEYQLLFPDTKEVRVYLKTKHRALRAELSQLISTLSAKQDSFGCNDFTALGANSTRLSQAIDLQSLIGDLIVCLQNISLGQLTNRSVPSASIDHPLLPHIIVGETGDLEVLEPFKSGY